MTHPDFAWVDALAHRYARVLSSEANPSADRQRALHSLQFASAALASTALHEGHPQLATQIAIVGPTQSGKSTLVNQLLDNQAATVSPLAGFTVHAQGYGSVISEADRLAIASLMAPLKHTPANALDNQDLQAYALETVNPGRAALVSNAVVWDTPDFDSIDARHYAEAVLRIAALADVVMLVVSKDKYGDKRVWDMLSLLNDLAKPLIICINKLDTADESAIRSALTRRYRESFDLDPPALVLLPYLGKSENRTPEFPDDIREHLHQVLNSTKDQQDRQQQAKTVIGYINRHESAWLAPLYQEHEAARQWQDMVHAMINQIDEDYAATYLENPQKYETFNRTLAELLTLLEIPGVASALSRTRQVITWPARRLLGVGRAALQGQFPDKALGASNVSEEAEVMKHLYDSAMITLQSQLLEQGQTPWWSALEQRFRTQATQFAGQFVQTGENARRDFEPEIDAAARELFEQLQQQPRLLNTLRAARVSADAAGVALAVKSGGLAPADLVLAPAMLSVTTLMTESALGTYMNQVKRQLKQRQRTHMMEQVWSGFLGRQLLSLPERVSDTSLFTTGLEPSLQAKLHAQGAIAPSTPHQQH